MKNLSNFLRLAVLVIVTGIAMTGHAQTNYYSKSTGNLNLTSSWSTSASGTGGTAPTSFTANNQIFNIRNNAAPTINANWIVSGGGSYIVVGDGTNACNFQIPSNRTCTGKINVSANATLSIANTTNPTLDTLNASSTVVFNGSGAQTIPVAKYGNLTYSNTGNNVSSMAGGCAISGTFTVSKGSLSMNNSNSNYTFTVGNLAVSTSGSVYFGGNGNASGGTTINLSGNMTETGSASMTVTGTSAPNGTINFNDTTQTIQTIQAYGTQWINYNIDSGAVVILGGNFAFAGDNLFPASFTVNQGGTLNCGTNVVKISPGDAQGNFILSPGGNLITGNTAGIESSGASGSIQTTARTYSSEANYTYNGTAAQSTGAFSTTPTDSTVNNLTINNTSAAGVTLGHSLSVAGVLTLTDGLLTTTTTNLITVNNGGSTTGASNNSFVNGPIAKVGEQSFTFPIGAAGTGYVPIGISAPSTTTDVFLAQYNRSSGAALGPITADSLNHVSSCDYWTLNHRAGSSAVNVTGYWNANSPCGGTYVNDLATIALAHFNGTSWNAWGSDAFTGSTASGSVTWNNVSNFSPFALSSISIFDPLPVTLVDFNATWQTGGTVGLTWEIQEGVNTNHFDIQRSADGVNWQTIGTQAASGSSSMASDYSYTDADPLPGQDYYRLQLVDDNGNDTYSTVRVLSRSAGMGITIFPNPATDHINIRFGVSGALGSPGTGGPEGPASIRLMNVTGQVLLQESVTQPAGQTITLPVAGYPSGSYLVQVLAAGEVKQSGIVLIIKL
jgi:Secretion system C-terminal sorting domain